MRMNINGMPLTPEERRQKNIDALKKFRPLDDTFMRELFRNDLELAQFMLRIILSKPDLTLTKEETQYDLKYILGNRSVTLDVFGVDSSGKQYDCEVQKANEGAEQKRARYHSAAMDVDNLEARDQFDKLPDTYVIFITENDVFGTGHLIHTVERVDTVTGKPFDDGEHIIYVNGAYNDPDDTSDLAKLVHDFRCNKASDMLLAPFADKTRFFKETQEGVDRMCKVMEDIMEERMKDTRYREKVGIAVAMLRDGKLSNEDIAKYTGLTVEKVNELKANLEDIPA